MDDAEPITWSLDDHLQRGREAIRLIAGDPRSLEAQLVCHHFSAGSRREADRILVEDGYAERAYGPVRALLAARGLDYLVDRQEAWERCIPTLQWLETRIPELFALAATHNQLVYDGWTWEPENGQPIAACAFPVINNR